MNALVAKPGQQLFFQFSNLRIAGVKFLENNGRPFWVTHCQSQEIKISVKEKFEVNLEMEVNIM